MVPAILSAESTFVSAEMLVQPAPSGLKGTSRRHATTIRTLSASKAVLVMF